MRLTYYPGCSLSATGRAYDESTRAVCSKIGVELKELDDWNCCGATSYMSAKELLSYSISARNLCLAQQEGHDVVAPCAACFTILRKTDHYLADIPELRSKVAKVLAAAELEYEPGSVKVKHLIEVFGGNDGHVAERIRSLVQTPLTGLKIAPYYGCQVVRPPVEFDHPEFPTTMDDLMSVLGASVVYFPAKARCCGASLMASNQEAAFRLCRNILLCAQENQADCIVTACPLCQMNLDAFQDGINARYGTRFAMPVLYFTQLVGIALGIPATGLGLGREIVAAGPLLSRFADVPKPLATAHEAGKEAR
jgi:heterodisulfide reductase subunit B2